MTRSAMQADSEPIGDYKTCADDRYIDHRQRRDEIGHAVLPERHQERADDLRPGSKQINAGRIFPHEDEEDEQPACQEGVANERKVISRRTRASAAPTARAASSSSGFTCSRLPETTRNP